MSAAELANPTLIERMHANTVEFYRTLARCSTTGAIAESHGLVLVSSGLPVPDFNLAYVLPNIGDPAAAVARAVAFYGPLGAPWTLMAFDQPTADLLAPAAAEAGLARNRAWPGLLLAGLRGEGPPLPAGLSIVAVETRDGLRRLLDAMAAGFEAPREMLDPLDTPRWLAVPDLRMYLGYIDGRPVGTAMRFVSHGIAGVQAVSTLPEARGRGIGAALTWHAATDAGEVEPLASALQSSDLGYGVYRRLGYEHVVDYPTWTPQRPAPVAS